MPHAASARSIHAFRPSEQTHGAISNAPLIAPSGSAATATGDMGPPALHRNGAFESSDDESIPPGPSTPVRPPSSNFSSASKRKRSALDDDDASTSSFGSKQSRRSVTSGAAALHGIKDMIEGFSTSMRSGPLGQPRHHRRSSAERRIEATALLQWREDLSADQVVAFADLFEQTTVKADTYMALIRDDVRKLWVDRQLVELGFPAGNSGADSTEA
jgi:hypothetical protein